MGIGRWLPPALLVVLFGGVVAVDLYRALETPTVDRPQVLLLEQVRFEPDDYVLDFRDGSPEAEDPRQAVARPTLEGAWGKTAPGGRWTSGAQARLSLDLPVGGQRVLLLHCRPDRNRRPPPRLVVTVNGVRGVPIALRRDLEVYRCPVAPDTVVAGANRVEVDLVEDSDGRPAAGRTLLLRHLALAKDPGAVLPDLLRQRPVRIDHERGRVVVTTAGRLLIPFQVPRAGTYLTLRYRFQGPPVDFHCTLVVGRSYPQPGAVDIMASEPLRAGDDGGGALRVSLGDHTGASVLWVQVDRRAAAAGVVLEQPVLALLPHGG